MKKFRVIVSLVVLMALSMSVYAQGEVEKAYPTKNITIIVNRSAGGGSDVMARFLAAQLEPVLGVNCTVINKTGGDGVIGINELVKAKPDGYTLFVCAPIEIAYSIVNGTGVDYTADDFSYFGSYNIRGSILATKTGSEFKTLDDLIAYAKANPGRLTIGVPGGANIQIAKDFNESLGIDCKIINSGGGSDLFAQLLGGHIDLGLIGAQFYDRLIGENCAVLGQTVDKRVYGIADVPTFVELGYNLIADTRMFLGGSAKLSAEVQETLTNAMNTLFADKTFEEKLRLTGETPRFLDKAEFNEYIKMYNDEMIPKFRAK
jgi:tripartite-type tricarboxylate transporter receptor subunit TctC